METLKSVPFANTATTHFLIRPPVAPQPRHPKRRLGHPPDSRSVRFTVVMTPPRSLSSLLRDLDLVPVDAGPLTSARFIEPAGMLNVQLSCGMGLGPFVGMKVLRG
jgi:hypothetical protein